MHRAIALVLSVSLAACSHVDTGEIDYRRAELPENPAARIAEYGDAPYCAFQARSELEDKITRHYKPGSDTPCRPLLKGRLFRKNVGIGDAIRNEDVYSIRLEHGLIAFMTEPNFAPSRLLYGGKMGVAIGEIVVLANTFEFGEDPATPSAFVDLTDLSQVKVVYYGPDVHEGQDLNFSNIPLKAPATYNGNPVGIQIVVLELDRMSSQMQSLLKTLAGLGQQSNLVPGGQFGGLLLDLGTSMLTQNNDDTIFEYRFVLDPSDGSLTAQSAPFEAGRYVIKRTDDRRQDQIWRNLVVDHNTGRLLRIASDGSAVRPTPYTEDTYFTINVIKHPQGTEPSDYGFKTLETLGTEIETAAANRDRPLGELDTELQAKIVELRASRWAQDLVGAWQSATGLFRAYGRMNMADGVECTTVEDYARRLAIADFEARNSGIAFITTYKDALAEKTAAGEDVFSVPEQRRILGMMGPFFMPETAGSITMDELTSPEIFESKYVSEDISVFPEAMATSATANWSAKNCEALIAINLAVGDQGDETTAN